MDIEEGWTITVGYLGPQGTFSEQAALAYMERSLARVNHRNAGKSPFLGTSGIMLEARRSIRDLVMEVIEGSLDMAILPLENSIEGSVSETLDLLVWSGGFHIIGEVVIPVAHDLMAYPGTRPEDIEEVLSHPQALAQCRGYLQSRFPGARLLATNSTAEAAEEVKRRGGRRPVAAVVGPSRAGEIYELVSLDRGVQDFPGNRTRFLAISKDYFAPRTGQDKTSLVFSTVKDRPGALCAILEEFASRGINLTRIESRPTKRMLGEYVFFIDLEGHEEEESVREALKAVERKSSFLKVLGSYPASQEPSGDEE